MNSQSRITWISALGALLSMLATPLSADPHGYNAYGGGEHHHGHHYENRGGNQNYRGGYQGYSAPQIGNNYGYQYRMEQPMVNQYIGGYAVPNYQGNSYYGQPAYPAQNPYNDRRDWNDGDADDRRDHYYPQVVPRFEDQHRSIIRNYYYNEYRSGYCPPGLILRHGVCAPSRRNHAWVVGQPLPRNVVYYELAPQVISQIGYPPQGYRYVRVGPDILMMAIGTSMIVDAINDW